MAALVRFVLVLIACAACGQLLASPAEAKEGEAKAAAKSEAKNASTANTKSADKAGQESATKKSATSKQKQPAAKRKVRYAEMVLDGALPELIGETGPFGDLKVDLRKIVARFETAAKDDRIAGIVLDLRNPMIGRGTTHELREAIRRFQKSGKKVHAQLEIATPSAYLVACVCDEIVMPESGFLLLPGVRAEPVFYKGLLTKLGIEADFLHMGEAKGAGESFTRDKWSEPVKKNLTAMIDSIYEQMIETLVRDRPITDKQAREAIDRGLITASEAREYGLVDRLAYPDELRASIADLHHDRRLVYVRNYGAKEVDTDFSGPAGFFKLMGMLAGGKSGSGRSTGKKIAVVYALGPIMPGKSQNNAFSGQTMGSTTIVRALDKAARDENVAAIVLRVNSPGGSALASDLIWRKTQQIDKPIVASMGDVAASGGYYISMGADKIFCEPGGITGSIGVVSGKFAIAGMYDKLGLTTDLISRGKNSGIFSGLRAWNTSERAAMLRMMEDCYDQFTSKAAEGRGMSVEDLRKLASGKVYTGVQAKANGLVDETGSLADAIAEAKRLARIGADEKVKMLVLPKPVEFFEAMFGNLDKEKEVRLSLDQLGLPKELARAAGRLHTWQRLFEREPVGLMMPYDLVIE